MLNESVQAPEDSHYLYVGVGDRATWKDPNCIFRTHKDTQLKRKTLAFLIPAYFKIKNLNLGFEDAY